LSTTSDQGLHEGLEALGADRTGRRPRSLAGELVRALGDRVRDGRLAPGSKLPTEAQIVGEFGVSRTVVREALSQLQAAGLVRTRHGVGTFVVGPGRDGVFRIGPQQLETLRDVVAVLELRIGVETEAAALAAQRRTELQLAQLRQAMDELF
jgi:DNA-binding FadR family transcriptional regulator